MLGVGKARFKEPSDVLITLRVRLPPQQLMETRKPTVGWASWEGSTAMGVGRQSTPEG